MIWGNSVYTEGSPATAQPSTGTTARGIRWVPGGLACAPLTHELSCIFLSAPPQYEGHFRVPLTATVARGHQNPSPGKKPPWLTDSFLTKTYFELCRMFAKSSQPFFPGSQPPAARIRSKTTVFAPRIGHRDDLIQLFAFHIKHPSPRKGND